MRSAIRGITVALAAALAVALPAQAWHAPRHQAAGTWEPGGVESLFVHDEPSVNEGGGSWAWTDYGLYRVLRATRPSPAAKTICDLDSVGDSVSIAGGMLNSGRWTMVAASALTRLPGDVDILVDDPSGTHGGPCAPVGLVLRRVG
jgi:hypothetical protein